MTVIKRIHSKEIAMNMKIQTMVREDRSTGKCHRGWRCNMVAINWKQMKDPTRQYHW